MSEILIFIIVGFIAQVINGSLGMSYGTLSVAILLTIGIPPVIASTSVHISKAVTGYASGLSHWKLGNVEKKLALKLIASGIAGGIVGAFVLSWLPEGILSPFIAIYLLATGLMICLRSFRQVVGKRKKYPVMPLGVIGGFVDAVGGGGWGPVVTSTLLSKGYNVRRTIGSVSFAEAFVASAITVVLLFNIPFTNMNWNLVIGLMIGGIFASPLAAFLCNKLPVKQLTFAVGLLLVVLSIIMLGSTLQ